MIEQHSYAYVVVGGDSSVDFMRKWHHTDLLREFYDEVVKSSILITLKIETLLSPKKRFY